MVQKVPRIPSRPSCDWEPLKRDLCYWATRHTTLWPTNRLYSHTTLLFHPPLSNVLCLSGTLHRLLGPAPPCKSSVLHVMRNEPCLSLPPSSPGDYVPRDPVSSCTSAWSNALHHSLASVSLTINPLRALRRACPPWHFGLRHHEVGKLDRREKRITTGGDLYLFE